MTEKLEQHGRNCRFWNDQYETDCNCGLRYRIELQTEREMHAAWRKRAEEAEAVINALPQGVPVTDVRWAVNVLLEQVAAKFDTWDTWDLFRSEAAATVRSFKHDLSSQVPRPHDRSRP